MLELAVYTHIYICVCVCVYLNITQFFYSLAVGFTYTLMKSSMFISDVDKINLRFCLMVIVVSLMCVAMWYKTQGH